LADPPTVRTIDPWNVAVERMGARYDRCDGAAQMSETVRTPIRREQVERLQRLLDGHDAIKDSHGPVLSGIEVETLRHIIRDWNQERKLQHEIKVREDLADSQRASRKEKQLEELERISHQEIEICVTCEEERAKREQAERSRNKIHEDRMRIAAKLKRAEALLERIRQQLSPDCEGKCPRCDSEDRPIRRYIDLGYQKVQCDSPWHQLSPEDS
jgi:hypothetical protein